MKGRGYASGKECAPKRDGVGSSRSEAPRSRRRDRGDAAAASAFTLGAKRERSGDESLAIQMFRRRSLEIEGVAGHGTRDVGSATALRAAEPAGASTESFRNGTIGGLRRDPSDAASRRASKRVPAAPRSHIGRSGNGAATNHRPGAIAVSFPRDVGARRRRASRCVRPSARRRRGGDPRVHHPVPRWDDPWRRVGGVSGRRRPCRRRRRRSGRARPRRRRPACAPTL